MTNDPDPGWHPAITVALAMIRGRGTSGSILLVMRAGVVLLSFAAGASALGVLIFGAGSGEPAIDATAARIGISAALGASVIATSFIGREGPDVADERRLAVSLFRTTMRRVLAAAAVGPAGFMLSWLSADATYVIFGTGLALLLMAVAGPSARRLQQYQDEVREAGSDLSVLEALSLPYR